ncbi:uncharacterized protein F4822DRAFT_435236 [Hypoxylon trugodes]|uniref:uncharacterized protein n=1 Tax=Hypoxylon trugodes TaxID=326681 RepID=UPI00219B3ADF|nr:uncharacterized protein F4822DRAFT_435236 [Hypoxylon trugodes]KAI1382861.1 hypothetical protein F4822DRAFT_435236 [Hypoxylon trugodes]
MCWANPEWRHCYECQQEFDCRIVFTPCYVAENGGDCKRRTERRAVYVNHRPCPECKETRKAEEACQQHIHQQVPLYFNPDSRKRKRRRCLRETYWAYLEQNRETREMTLRRRALAATEPPPPPMFKMFLHQPHGT